MITSLFPHLALPLRVAAFLVASILIHGILFRSPSAHLRSLKHHTIHTVEEVSRNKHVKHVTPSFLKHHHHTTKGAAKSSSTSSTSSITSSTWRNQRRQQEQFATPVPVEISIESLCIDCHEFILHELVPTFQLLGPTVMDLSLIVFGNAKLTEDDENDTHQLTCQHGEGECDANSYQQCAIDRFPSPSRYLPFIACLFETLPMGRHATHFGASEFAHCARHSGLDWRVLQACHDDPDEQWRLQKRAQQHTPPHDHVPWVKVSGLHVSEQEGSLLQAVCDAYMRQGGQHAACVSSSATQRSS